MSSTWAGVVSWFAGAVVSYVLTRWAWKRTGKPDLLRETLPFVAISVVVVLLMSLATKLGYLIAADLRLRGVEHVAVVETVYIAANLGTFLMRFVIFNLILFRDRKKVAAEAPQCVTVD